MMKKKFRFWSLGHDRAGQPKWAVGKWGPRMIIIGEKEDAKAIRDCFNSKLKGVI